MVGHSTHKEKEVPFVNIANLSLYYDETGKGYPIVLIHGFFGWGNDEMVQAIATVNI